MVQNEHILHRRAPVAGEFFAGRILSGAVVVNPEPLTAPNWENGTLNEAHLLVNDRY